MSFRQLTTSATMASIARLSEPTKNDTQSIFEMLLECSVTCRDKAEQHSKRARLNGASLLEAQAPGEA